MNTHTPAAGPDPVPISEGCAALREAGFPLPRGGYRALQSLAASAAFPAHKRNGRWYFWRADLHLVAASYADGHRD